MVKTHGRTNGQGSPYFYKEKYMVREIFLRLLLINKHPKMLHIGLFWANTFCLWLNLTSKEQPVILVVLSGLAIILMVDSIYKQIIVENNEKQGETNVKSKNH